MTVTVFIDRLIVRADPNRRATDGFDHLITKRERLVRFGRFPIDTSLCEDPVSYRVICILLAFRADFLGKLDQRFCKIEINHGI